MLPSTFDDNVEVLSDFAFTTQTSNTYKVNLYKNNISGFCDELEAVKQTVYLILNIERYEYLIYDWDYGFEIKDLIGQESIIIQPEIQRRICDALKQDSRIVNVRDFVFENGSIGKLIVHFTVETIFGSYQSQNEFYV